MEINKKETTEAKRLNEITLRETTQKEKRAENTEQRRMERREQHVPQDFI